MSKNEKLKKLENAIGDYRGRFNIASEKWIKAPKIEAEKRVLKWLSELGLAAPEYFEAVKGFKTFEEMRTFLKSL